MPWYLISLIIIVYTLSDCCILPRVKRRKL